MNHLRGLLQVKGGWWAYFRLQGYNCHVREYGGNLTEQVVWTSADSSSRRLWEQNFTRVEHGYSDVTDIPASEVTYSKMSHSHTSSSTHTAVVAFMKNMTVINRLMVYVCSAIQFFSVHMT